MKSLMILFLHGCAGCIGLLAAAPVPSAAAVFQAIRSSDIAALDALLREGDVLQARDEAGNTPLMAAALAGDVAVVRRLLDAGADVNATNDNGVTPLMRAATFEEAVRLLVEKGADVTARSKMGNSAVLLAARKPGNSRTVAFLLDHGADANAENAFRATALMAAVASDDIETVRLVLDRGADVNRIPKPGSENFFWGGWRTPLMWAAYLGDEAMCRLLLERGARVNDFVETGSALGQAAWAGQAGVARILLDAGAQVDQRDLVANYTPLHWAASSERSSPELVELLLARGADANAEGGQSVDNFLGVAQTPLMLARKRGETPIVRALLKAGAREVASADRQGKPGSPTLTTPPSGSPLEALQRAVLPLTRTAEESVSTFLRHATHQDCVSCHQQQLPLPALSLAHSRHASTDREATRHQVLLARRSFFTGHIQHGGDSHAMLEVNLQTTFHPEPGITDGYYALGFRLENEPASVVTDSMVHQLATIQFEDGHWSRNLPRPPMQASDITATAQAIYTLRTYPIPSRQKELATRVQRGRDWLAKADVETNEERVHQLMGLAWAGDPPETLKPLAEALVRQQRDDGGWAQLAGLGSDAYATGQSIYALLEAARLPAGEPAVRRGINFLIASQRPDGTWHVRTRSHPFQPPMDSGFPHGRDGWISAAGTSWAAMALAAAVDPATVTPASAPLPSTPAATPVALPASIASTSVEFTRDIQPLLEKSCAACHAGDHVKGGFSMANRASFLQGGNRGEPVVVPNRPEASPLFRIVQDQVEDLEMPPLEKRPTYPAWTKHDIALFAAWISQGAPWPESATLHPPEN